MAKSNEEIDRLLKECGFLNCQISVTDYVRRRENELNLATKLLQEKIDKEPSLIQRQKLINELWRSLGEVEGLRSLWTALFSLPRANGQKN